MALLTISTISTCAISLEMYVIAKHDSYVCTK